MTLAPTAHLSEEALNDVLIGLASPEAKAHVAICALCRSQVDEFHADLRLFDETSLAWTKSRAVNKLRVPAPWDVRQAMLAPIGWAMAAVVVLMMVIPSWMGERSAPHGPVAVAGAEYGDSDAQIAQDNDLLRSVDTALNPNEDTTLQQYGLSASATTYRKQTARP